MNQTQSRSRTARWVGAYGTTAAALACTLTWAPPANAQAASNKAAAEALFDEGRKLMGEGKIAEACPKFADSEQLDPSSGTLLNLANCYEKRGRTASAWATYREAASLASANGRSDNLSIAEKRANALAPKLSRVTVVVASPVDGLEVKRDGATVTRAEWGMAIPVDPGPHNYEATAAGHKAWSGSIDVTGEATVQTLSVPALALDDSAAPAAPVADVPVPIAPGPPADAVKGDTNNTQRTIGQAFTGVGVLTLGVGAAFALSANSKYNSSLTSCPHDKNLCTPQGVAERDDARSAGNVASVILVVGAAVVVGGVVIWLTAPSAASHETPAIAIAPTLGGAMMRGTF